MLRLATYNVNGIRAAHRRGITGWQERCQPDVTCLQEVRCRVGDLPTDAFGDFHTVYSPGVQAGRNGVAVLTREPVDAVRSWGGEIVSIEPGGAPETIEPSQIDIAGGTLARELNAFVDTGRYIEVDLADHPVTIACLYLPKGDAPENPVSRSREPLSPEQLAGVQARYDAKMAFLAGFAKQLSRTRRAALASGREFVVVGDFNIAHQKNDVKNWRPAQKASGFLPEERAWLDEQINPRTLVDVVRTHYPDQNGPYSWWSWMGQAFARDTGWRIDYHLATPRLAKAAEHAFVDRDPDPSARVSDHAPVVVDYQI